MTLTVYGYDAYRAEDVDALDVGSVFSTHLTALWKHRT